MSEHQSVEDVRLQKRSDLLASGRAPYLTAPGEVRSLSSIRSEFEALEPDTTTDSRVRTAGRVMFFRSSGKIAFVTLQEGDGTRLQLMLPAQDLGAAFIATGQSIEVPEGQDPSDPVSVGKVLIKDFARSVDLGDHIIAEGLVATSIKGELSVRVDSWTMATKSLRPLPFLHAELSDEVRVRRPYLDWLQSESSRDRVRARSIITREVRRALDEWDFLEVETPILQATHGGAQARPFTTRVNALDQDFSLRIALETSLKKCVVGGLERVYEIGRVFRNEGSDSSHSPEFTMLEFYAAYSDMCQMAELVQALFRRVCARAGGIGENLDQLRLSSGAVLNFGGDWRWLSVYDGVSEAAGTPVGPDSTVEELQSLCSEHGVSFDPSWPAGKLVMELSSELVEPHLVQPTFLHDWPAEAQPLAARNPEDPRRVLAWDLIVNGMEIGCAFTELTDPVIQREILTAQSVRAAQGDPEAMSLDEDFLTALEYGMAPAGGCGIGMDRLVGLFTEASVREAVLFPLVRRDEA